MNDRIVIGGPTALRIACDRTSALFVRPSDIRGRPSLLDLGSCRHPPACRTLEALREACAPYGTVHLYVPTPAARTRHRGFSSHLWGGPVPEGSLWLWEDPAVGLAVHVVTPALALTQTAALADDTALIGAASELMGRYPAEGGETSPPSAICTRDVLLAELDGLPRGTAGLRRARAAVDLAFAGGRSPLEVATAAMLSLPRRLGGLGLPRPELDHAVEVHGALRRQLGYSPLHGDVVWPEARLVIEYQGEHHFGRRTVAEDDINRASVLRQMGWWVEQWVARDLRDLLRLDDGAARVARRLDLALPEPDGEFRSLQGRLYGSIVRWRDAVASAGASRQGPSKAGPAFPTGRADELRDMNQ